MRKQVLVVTVAAFVLAISGLAGAGEPAAKAPVAKAPAAVGAVVMLTGKLVKVDKGQIVLEMGGKEVPQAADEAAVADVKAGDQVQCDLSADKKKIDKCRKVEMTPKEGAKEKGPPPAQQKIVK